MLFFLMLVTVFFQTPVIAEAVTPSDVNYSVSLKNNVRLFMHNKKTIGSEVGTEYYMTYTVKDVTAVGTQQGVMGAQDYLQSYPYQNNKGMMRFTIHENFLLEEGATYFIKVTVIAKGGFRYNVTKAKGDSITNLYFDKLTGGAKSDMLYYGLWIAQGVKGDNNTTAELTNVRCYDAKGNDLGVQVSCDCVGLVTGGSADKQDSKLNYYYEIDVDEKAHVAVSNKKATDSDKIYMEYEVREAEYAIHQEGVALSNSPQSTYPHSKGQLRYVTYDEPNDSVELLQIGAKYLVAVEKSEDKYEVSVQRIKDGKVTNFNFQRSYKTYDPGYQYASLWFSELYGEIPISFKLTNVKIYDAKHNDLGVQCNKEAVIIRRGALDGYEDCEATYYCKENGNSLALYEDQTIKFTKDGATEEGTYEVLDNVMTVSFGSGDAEYEYYYKQITDDEGNVYERLYNYKIRFVTGNGSKVETQKISNKTGYVAKEPETPTLEGCEFLGWYRKDGSEYDFTQLVTESATLYAKWSGEGGVVFVSEENNVGQYVMLGVSILALAGGLTACVVFIRKGVKKRENQGK